MTQVPAMYCEEGIPEPVLAQAEEEGANAVPGARNPYGVRTWAAWAWDLGARRAEFIASLQREKGWL